MKLSKAIDGYVSSKVHSGVKYKEPTRFLLRFAEQVGDITVDQIGRMHVAMFLDELRSPPSTWLRRYAVMYHFLEYCYARQYIDTIAMPERRLAKSRTFNPYIYSREEVRRLLRAIPGVQGSRRKIAPDTFRMIILFIYGTGATVTEMRRLRREDIDFSNNVATLYASEAHNGRKIPICMGLMRAICAYDRSHRDASAGAPFFRTKKGSQPSLCTLAHNFRGLTRVAKMNGLRKSGLQPTLSDLRHTFAVQRIASWLKHGADLNRMIPALSAYLGFAGLATAERYLRLSPDGFRRQLSLLSNDRKRPTWGKNRPLMQFLDSL